MNVGSNVAGSSRSLFADPFLGEVRPWIPSDARFDIEISTERQISVNLSPHVIARIRIFMALVLTLCLLTLINSSTVTPAQAQTRDPAALQPLDVPNEISSDITTNTTWTKAGSPYQVTSQVNVAAGVTLTVEPGVQVIFAQNAALSVEGTLTAVGTAAEPILFTGSTQEAGWWGGIRIVGTANAPLTTSVLDHVTIEYGGGNGYATLYLDHATVPVSNAIIRHSSKDGIYGWYDSVAHLTDVTLTHNARYPIQLVDGSLDPQLVRLTISDNGTDAIALGAGTMTGNHLWENVLTPYLIIGSHIVAPDATLIIEPGLQMQFAQNAALSVEGTLTAVGTAAEPILFTGSTQEAGWWGGIRIVGTANAPLTTSVLDHVTIEYGGGNGYATLYLDHATVPVSNAIIRHSSKDGIYGWYGSVAHLTDVTLTHNARYPIQLVDGSLDPQLVRLTISDNGTDAIALGAGTMTGNHLWENVLTPYLIIGNHIVAPGATLIIEPGLQMQFAQNAALSVEGTLTAVGDKEHPILLTGSTQQPGWWAGLRVEGSASNASANATLDYVTVEYGGGNGYANVYVAYGRVIISNSILRHSSKHGLYSWYGGAGSTIESSQIVDNADFGVYNIDGSKILLAANNWWGSATGPLFSASQGAANCNPGGMGSKVSGGVAFSPWLTSADAEPGPVLPSDMRTLSITPQRWFVPADGTSSLYVTIHLTDGSGRPVSGRQVQLSSTLGTVIDGGVTDVQGKTFAIVRSSTAGNAELEARLDAGTCEAARSTSATVTFTQDNPAGDLMTAVEAPYMNSNIEISPEPIMRGVPTRLRATLTNPNDFPILVDGLFGFAQAGIGLAFGPVGQVTNQLIPAHETAIIEVTWTPSVGGHYCVQFEYSSRAADGAGRAVTAGSGRSQRNLSVYPGPFLGPKQKSAIDKARHANDAIGDGSFLVSLFSDIASIPGGLLQGLMVGNILDFQYEAGGGINCALAGGTNCKGWQGPRMKLPGDSLGNLKEDPPRQDYKELAEPETLTYAPAGAARKRHSRRPRHRRQRTGGGVRRPHHQPDLGCALARSVWRRRSGKRSGVGIPPGQRLPLLPRCIGTLDDDAGGQTRCPGGRAKGRRTYQSARDRGRLSRLPGALDGPGLQRTGTGGGAAGRFDR